MNSLTIYKSLNPCREYLHTGMSFYSFNDKRKESILAHLEQTSQKLDTLKELRQEISRQREQGESVILPRSCLISLQKHSPQLITTSQLKGRESIDHLLSRIEAEEKMTLSKLAPLTHSLQQICFEQSELTKIVNDALRTDRDLCSKILSLSSKR